MKSTPLQVRSKIRQSLQPFFYSFGISKYCKQSLAGLDNLLEQYIDYKSGFFVEAGANDGLKQSNTYYLEAVKGWRGILIEPVRDLYYKCKQNRPNSICINAALVSSDYGASHVELEYADLMTCVSSSSENYEFDHDHVLLGKQIQSIASDAPKQVRAKALTLTNIFENYQLKRIDFMSLDLEGYEIEALRGLDLERYGPSWLLIEVRNLPSLEKVLDGLYQVEAELTSNEKYKDILFRKCFES